MCVWQGGGQTPGLWLCRPCTPKKLAGACATPAVLLAPPHIHAASCIFVGCLAPTRPGDTYCIFTSTTSRPHPLQDLPFTYRFGYLIGDVETSLVAAEQLGNTYGPFFLPAGPGASGNMVSLVTYVLHVCPRVSGLYPTSSSLLAACCCASPMLAVVACG